MPNNIILREFDQGSSLDSVRDVPNIVAGATHYAVTVVTISEGQ